MNQESRTVRPFSGTVPFELALSEIRLHVGSESYEPSTGRTTLSTEAFLHRPMELAFAEATYESVASLLERGMADHGYTSGDVALTVVASSPTLKIADIVSRQVLPSDGTIAQFHRLTDREPRPRALRAPRGGCDIHAYLHLDRNLEPGNLRPWRKGTWLARATFKLRTDLGTHGFVPKPLDDGQRERLGLNKSTVRYVEVDTDALTDRDGDLSSVTVWVDADLLARIAATPDAPLAVLVQRQLFIDAVAAIAAAAASRLGDRTYQDVEDSLLDRLIAAIAGHRASEADKISIFELLSSDPGKFIALAEARSGFAKSAVDVFQGEGT